MLPLAINQEIQSAVFFLGVAALFLGRLPGGLVGLLRRAPARLNAVLAKEYRRAQRTTRDRADIPLEPAFEPTQFARAVLNGRQPRSRVRS
jgi:hypothetical protein